MQVPTLVYIILTILHVYVGARSVYMHIRPYMCMESLMRMSLVYVRAYYTLPVWLLLSGVVVVLNFCWLCHSSFLFSLSFYCYMWLVVVGVIHSFEAIFVDRYGC